MPGPSPEITEGAILKHYWVDVQNLGIDQSEIDTAWEQFFRQLFRGLFTSNFVIVEC